MGDARPGELSESRRSGSARWRTRSALCPKVEAPGGVRAKGYARSGDLFRFSQEPFCALRSRAQARWRALIAIVVELRRRFSLRCVHDAQRQRGPARRSPCARARARGGVPGWNSRIGGRPTGRSFRFSQAPFCALRSRAQARWRAHIAIVVELRRCFNLRCVHDAKRHRGPARRSPRRSRACAWCCARVKFAHLRKPDRAIFPSFAGAVLRGSARAAPCVRSALGGTPTGD